MRSFIIGLCLSCTFLYGATLSAVHSQEDYDFHNEKMLVDHGEIFLVSTFDDKDGITVYNFNGQRLWEVRFHAKIVAWDVQPDIILVFSKDRRGYKTYLTCLDRITGRCLWERP